MNLEDIRKEIDGIDRELMQLFFRRMEVVKDVANYKIANGLPVLDKKREEKKLNDLIAGVPKEMTQYAHTLMDMLFQLSRNYQNAQMNNHHELYDEIKDAIQNTPQLFPSVAKVACQGLEGAYAHQACQRLFKHPSAMYFQNFEGVFSAIEAGLCDYGVLPLENSTAGSVNKVYDLMMGRNFKIVKSLRLKIDHCLLVKKGVKLENVKTIVSHEQAIGQCSNFLSKLDKDVKVIPVANTAIAAEMVANSDREDIAAIASHVCASTYGLEQIQSDIQDRGNNYTRFICISKNLEIYPGADRTSIMMILPHRPGSLYKTLSRFYSLGINLNKLESRPIPQRDFAFMFYFDLETSVYSQEFAILMDSLKQEAEEFEYLGSYLEVI